MNSDVMGPQLTPRLFRRRHRSTPASVARLRVTPVSFFSEGNSRCS